MSAMGIVGHYESKGASMQKIVSIVLLTALAGGVALMAALIPYPPVMPA